MEDLLFCCYSAKGWLQVLGSALFLCLYRYLCSGPLKVLLMRPLHGNWPAFYLLIHCIIGSYFVYLSIKNSIIFLPWHTNPRISMSM
ncbi:hypothetical protein CLI77_09345 [Porphyromonas gingivalis]|nr:hypothetical protein CLI77_09345 [Porphyromonas gingivalis]